MAGEEDFLHRRVPAFGKRVHRLGLAASKGLDGAGVREALDAGLNYVFWNPTARALVGPLREALRRDRERYVVATGPTFGWFAGSIRSRAEAALRLLGTDYLTCSSLEIRFNLREFTLSKRLFIQTKRRSTCHPNLIS